MANTVSPPPDGSRTNAANPSCCINLTDWDKPWQEEGTKMTVNAETRPEPGTAFALWPEGAPHTRPGDREGLPSLTAYYPENRADPVPAVLVLPGGGYATRAPHEGEPVARWLAELGYAAFVLQYRVAPYAYPVPYLDGLKALSVLRRHAAGWGIDADRIGVLGFSAGGHLAALLSTAVEPVPDPGGPAISVQRPDFSVLCYPVIILEGPAAHSGSTHNLLGRSADPAVVASLDADRRVDGDAPPTFLWHTADDEAVPVEHSLRYAGALAQAGVPFALHVYPHGRHGLGLAEDAPAVALWRVECAAWLQTVVAPGREYGRLNNSSRKARE